MAFQRRHELFNQYATQRAPLAAPAPAAKPACEKTVPQVPLSRRTTLLNAATRQKPTADAPFRVPSHSAPTATFKKIYPLNTEHTPLEGAPIHKPSVKRQKTDEKA